MEVLKIVDEGKFTFSREGQKKGFLVEITTEVDL